MSFRAIVTSRLPRVISSIGVSTPSSSMPVLTQLRQGPMFIRAFSSNAPNRFVKVDNAVLLREQGIDVESEYQKEIADIIHNQAEKDKRRQSLIGLVVSTKCSKSITVEVHRERLFPKYNKVTRIRRKFMAHDENELAEVGDIVRVIPCRKMSKKKNHSLIDILKKGNSLKNIAASIARTPRPSAAAIAASAAAEAKEVRAAKIAAKAAAAAAAAAEK